MDTFHKVSCICRNKALYPSGPSLAGEFSLIWCFLTRCPLRLLNLWPTLIKYEIKMQDAASEVLKLFCEVWDVAK